MQCSSVQSCYSLQFGRNGGAVVVVAVVVWWLWFVGSSFWLVMDDRYAMLCTVYMRSRVLAVVTGVVLNRST